MRRYMAGCCALALAFFVSKASGQTYEEIKNQNEELKARVQALEAEKNHKHDHDHDHEHGEKDEHKDENHKHDENHAHDGGWRVEDPYVPGWWRASDDYRPGSWMPPPSEGFWKDLFCGRHFDTHRNSQGTPWTHPFLFEPAQIHRDAFGIYKYTRDADGTATDEHEGEFHLDWGLTRRFGITLGVPYLGLIAPDGQATGFGDLEVAPRIVFIESDTFFLATNIAMTFPTGDPERDLGAGESTIAPFLTTWHDLGSWERVPWTHWNVLHLNGGPEIGLRSGDTSMTYAFMFSHSFLGPKIIVPHGHGGNSHQHNNHANDNHQETGGVISPIGPGYPPGLTSIILEFNGQSELQGDRLTTLQLLTGFSYVLTEAAEFRFGVNFPLNHPDRQFDAQYIIALSHIF